MAVGLLTASLDSAELEAWAVQALVPESPEALGDLLVGMHMVARSLLRELHQSTGQPADATLRRLAVLAEIPRRLPPGA